MWNMPVPVAEGKSATCHSQAWEGTGSVTRRGAWLDALSGHLQKPRAAQLSGSFHSVHDLWVNEHDQRRTKTPFHV